MSEFVMNEAPLANKFQFKPNKYDKFRQRENNMQNKALLNGLLNVAERNNQYLKSPTNYKEVRDRRSLINFKFKTYQNQIKVNHENRKIMKQLIEAPCRILTPRKGDKGWEKHA